MTDLSKPKHSGIPPDLREREKFLETIRAAADEIGYGPVRGETARLLRTLNDRSILYPDFRRGTFDTAMQYARPWETVNELRAFLNYHLPDLWEATTSRRRFRREDVNARVNTMPLTTRPVRTKQPAALPGSDGGQGTKAESTRPLRILGWTIQEDKRGIHRAFKRIGGKVRAVYLGKNLDNAEEKLKTKAASEPEY